VLLNGEWLSDVLVNAGQKLIQQAHPHVHGLQDVALGHTLAFVVMKGEFVQVLHSDKGRWVTVSTIGCQAAEIDMFDSGTVAKGTGLLYQPLGVKLHAEIDVFDSICALHSLVPCRGR